MTAEGVTQQTRSTCPYCGVGCGVIISANGGRITAVQGDPQHPANFGKLCTKGASLHLTAAAPLLRHARLLNPALRSSRDAPQHVCTWDHALNHIAQRIVQSQAQHGPDSIGLYVSGQLLTEDYYVFNKLAKGLLGTNNIDTNSRLCMSSAVAGYKRTLGADSVPSCYDDIDHCDVLLIAGSNTATAHPVIFRRIEAARARNPALRMIVIDPRATDTARAADRDGDLHLRILPGTDVALFHGMLHALLWEDLVDAAYIEAHTEGFAALKSVVRDMTPQRAARLCGITETDLLAAATAFGRARAALSMWCQGLNQSSQGTAKNAALINLHLACGQIGRPGAGPLSLTGQPNAMGGREVGGLANLLPGHREVANAGHRAEVARLWGVASVPATPGLAAVQLFEAAAAGRIKVLWIACTNPAQSLPNQALVRAALARVETVILQEAYADTETAGFADVLLPASSWGEKNGTVTNSERRISRVRPAVPAPGLARDDWAIVVDVARRIERLKAQAEAEPAPGATAAGADPVTPATLFAYPSAESIWLEHRETTRGRDLDITALTYAQLEAMPTQWPCAERLANPPMTTVVGAATAGDLATAAGTARLYTDGRFATPSGRARFDATAYQPVAEDVDARFPFRLNTGRLRDQWHGMSRTGTLGHAFGPAPEASIALHPSDVARRGLRSGQLVNIKSRRGKLVLPVAEDADMRSGEAFIAMHWGAAWVGGGADAFGVNALTLDTCDATSGQPELKHAAVHISAATLPWHYVAFAQVGLQQQWPVLRALRRHFVSFDFATAVPFGHEEAQSVLFRAASAAAPDTATLQAIEALIGIEPATAVQVDDASRGVRRRLQRRDGSVVAVALLQRDPQPVQPKPAAAGAFDQETAKSQPAQMQTSAQIDAQDAFTALERRLRRLLGLAGRSAEAASSGARQSLLLLLAPGGDADPRHRLGAQVAADDTRVICSCLNVSAQAIKAALQKTDPIGQAAQLGQDDPAHALRTLQARLGCGTQCGSCLPQLRQLVRNAGGAAALR